jgi:cell wall-associated NlpC family hydrolase
MDPVEQAQRNRVVAVARTWLGTPYHTAARVKGGGADCLTLLVEVFEEAGLIRHLEIPHYPADWHLHRDAERYLNGLLEHTGEVDGPPLPGDIALWRFGRCYSHGAIVVQWPTVIHAYVGRGCVLEDAEAATWLTHVGENTEERGKPRPRRIFSYWNRKPNE